MSPTAGLAPMMSSLRRLLRCLECLSPLELSELEPGHLSDLGPDGTLSCSTCKREYPVIGGTARLVRGPDFDELLASYGPRDGRDQESSTGGSASTRHSASKWRTAEGFAYEWEHFGQLRTEWHKNFLDYMQPHAAESFQGRLVLDVGAGSGRHSNEAAELGAEVVAVDLGRSIDVARRNLPTQVLTVQADAEDLPFEVRTFDFVMCIGVLHHLHDPESAFSVLTRYVRPGGHIQIYVYWVPLRPTHRMMLRIVNLVRHATVRMPYRLLHAASYPIAALLFLAFILPYRVFRSFSSLDRFADAFPLKAYADYPFQVCVNDQFDRFSALIEHRYTAEEVHRWFRSAGLEEISILPNNGWVASGRVPLNE